MKSNRCNRVSSIVDGKSGASNIAELFANTYKDLYNTLVCLITRKRCYH